MDGFFFLQLHFKESVPFPNFSHKHDTVPIFKSNRLHIPMGFGLINQIKHFFFTFFKNLHSGQKGFLLRCKGTFRQIEKNM